MIGIYKITNPKGQIYIGSSTNITRRWYYHKHYNRNTKIHKSIIEYGHETHMFEVLELCCASELLVKERYWQDFYLSYRYYNLNVHKADNLKRFGSKREKGKSIKKIYYMDSTTGVFYDSTTEIADLYSINSNTLRSKLLGFRRNDTIFVKV